MVHACVIQVALEISRLLILTHIHHFLSKMPSLGLWNVDKIKFHINFVAASLSECRHDSSMLSVQRNQRKNRYRMPTSNLLVKKLFAQNCGYMSVFGSP